MRDGERVRPRSTARPRRHAGRGGIVGLFPRRCLFARGCGRDRRAEEDAAGGKVARRGALGDAVVPRAWSADARAEGPRRPGGAPTLGGQCRAGRAIRGAASDTAAESGTPRQVIHRLDSGRIARVARPPGRWMEIWEMFGTYMKRLTIFGAVTCRKTHLWRNNRAAERSSHRLLHVLSTKAVEGVPEGSAGNG